MSGKPVYYPSPKELAAVKEQRALAKAKYEEIKRCLPHLHRFKWYRWAKAFYKSTNRMNLLCAANQISKSSTQIRKCIEWAGNTTLWPSLWKEPPRQFWYLYPTQEAVNMEWKTKWLPEFMPRDEYKTHKTYGWKTIKNGADIIGLEFNSGVIVYFRTYSQSASNLQTGTCNAIFCDEELPEDLYDELNMRISAVDGYFHMVFTATLNQNFWKMAIEGENELEKWPDAFKQQISMWDCVVYDDGTPGAYNEEKIKRIIATCKSETEVQRRVYGRFVTELGRKYPQFDATRHYIKPITIPTDWRRYAAVDIGSGGAAHPPAICFVAVRPDNRYGVVYKGWMGDDGKNYTNGDIYQKFLEMRGNDVMTEQRYDQQARDFKTITDRASDTFIGSDKAHTRGEDVVNTLFKNKMLFVFDDSASLDPQLHKLGNQLTELLKETPKKKAKDDFPDALRYCVVTIPWDWSCLIGEKTDDEKEMEALRPMTDEDRIRLEIEERRGEFIEKPKESDWSELDEEIEEWNSQYAG